MFGYVTVSKEHFTEEEFNSFTAYYCGLCKAVGRQASQAARLALSYDITFLSLVLSSVASSDTAKRNESCIAHPIKKRECVVNDRAVDYSAAMGVLLSYLKLKDDWHDDRNLKALFGMALLYPGYRRAVKGFAAKAQLINSQLAALSRLETERCSSIDETADAFAKILEALFTPEFIKDSSERRSLAWLGYNLGRWIYIIDAVNDIEDDKKSRSYNPLLQAGLSDRCVAADRMEPSLTFTLENISSAFELTHFKQNKTIIGKIIYLSLKNKQKSILDGTDLNSVSGICRKRRKDNQ